MEYIGANDDLVYPEKMKPLFEFVPVDYIDRTQVMCTMGRPIDVQSHFHLDGEVILAMAGSAFLCCEGQGYYLQKGDMFFVNPMTIHYVEATSDDCLLLMVHFDMGATTLTFGADADPYHWEYLLYPGCLDEKRMDILRRELLYMAETFYSESAGAGQRLEIPGRFLCFMSYLFRWGLYRQSKSASRFMHYEIDQGRTLMNYINAKASTQLTLTEAAETVGMTGRDASKLLKKLTGRSFSDYLSGVRLEMAKKKLVFENDKPVLDIAMESGFASLATFYRIFSKFTGMSPNEFRSRMGRFITRISQGGYEITTADEALQEIRKMIPERL